MGRNDENSEWMAGDEFCFEAVCTVCGKYWRQWNGKTMEYEMSLSICYRGMFGFLFLELMKVILLRAPCSNRSKHRGIIFWSDSSCGITFLLSKVHLVSKPRGKLIFFSNPLVPQAIYPLSELIISYKCSKTLSMADRNTVKLTE